MRAFEILTLLASLVTLIAFLLPQRKEVSTVRAYAPIAATLFVVIHLILERYRWQMVPLYGLILLLLIISVMRLTRRRAATTGRSPSRKRKIVVGTMVVLGLAYLTGAAAILIAFPVVQLPQPTGPYAVGTTFLQFVDRERPETLTEDPADIREFTGRVWYPAIVAPRAKPMPYQQPSPAVGSIGGFETFPDFLFSHLALSKSNSYLDAPVSANRSAYPVLLFSSGFLAAAEDYQMITEELASHGYIVVSLTNPYESQSVVHADGSVVPFRQEHGEDFQRHMEAVLPMWERFWKSSDTEERNGIATQILESETFMDNVLRIRVADVQFAVDEMQRMNAGDRESIFAGKLDLSRLGILGHSMGGGVAGQTCLVDERFKAGVNLDGFQFGDVVDGEIRQPFMTIYSEQFTRANDYILDRFESVSYTLTIEGTTHSNFQDVPFVLPASKRIGLAGPISATRAARITNDYLLAFFAKHLAGEGAPLLDQRSPDYPEVEFDVRHR